MLESAAKQLNHKRHSSTNRHESRKEIQPADTQTGWLHPPFFKQIFSRPEIVRDFIQSDLPPEIVSHLALETLEVVNASYVHADMSEYFSDVCVSSYLQESQCPQ